MPGIGIRLGVSDNQGDGLAEQPSPNEVVYDLLSLVYDDIEIIYE